jgi:RND family efflux transporter MFP subunit
MLRRKIELCRAIFSLALPTSLAVSAACSTKPTSGAQAGRPGPGDSGVRQQGAGASVPTVAVVTVHSSVATKTVSEPGELRPFQEVRIFPKISGFIRDIPIDRGSRVKKGDVLARLDAPELRAQINEAESRAAAADAALAEARARYESSRATYARIRAAAATDGVVAPDEVERVLATARADSARWVAASSQAAAAHSAQRSVADLGGYLVVTAPFDGLITERNVHPGALVGPSGTVPMFKLQDDSRLRLAVSLPEAYVGSVVESGGAAFQVRAFPSDTFHAQLARKAGALDLQTRAEVLEFDVVNESGKLEAGMYADVLVPLGRAAPTLLVPASAVGTSVDGPFVITVSGDTAHWVSVRRGDAVGDRVEIFGGVRDGDQLAAHASDEIRSGSRVHIALPAARASPSAVSPAKP